MSAALRPYVTAGVALVGASLIAVTPIAPQAAGYRAVAIDVSLAAASTATCTTKDGTICGGADAPASYPAITASNVLNIPANLFNAIISIPAAEIAGMNLLAKSLEETGSLLVWSPTNAFGFDQADPDKLKAVYDLLIPFPALSSVIGAQAVVWAQANLPVNAGCAALPGACPDRAAILAAMFKVPTSELYSGYTFPAAVNPFDGSDVEYPVGYVKLDPDAPGKAFLASLLATPTGPQTVSLQDISTTFVRLGAALFKSFYPFVQNSEYYNPDETGLAYIFRALSPLLCADCNRDPANGYAGVYQPDYLYGNYDPHYPAAKADTQTLGVTTFALPGGDVDQVDDSGTSPKSGAGKLAEPKVFASSEQQLPDSSKDGLPAANIADPTEDVPAVGSGGVTVTPGTASTTTPSGKHWKLGADTSMSDKLKSTITKFTDGLKSGGATKTGADAKVGVTTGAASTTATKVAAKEKESGSEKSGE